AIVRPPIQWGQCELARFPQKAAPLEAMRRVLPERAEGRSDAIVRPLRKRWALPVKCSFENTSPDLVQPERGWAHRHLGRTQKFGNRTDHRDSKGWTSKWDSTNSLDSTNSRDIPTRRNSHNSRMASRPKAPIL